MPVRFYKVNVVYDYGHWRVRVADKIGNRYKYRLFAILAGFYYAIRFRCWLRIFDDMGRVKHQFDFAR